jgi:hypothetical protein
MEKPPLQAAFFMGGSLAESVRFHAGSARVSQRALWVFIKKILRVYSGICVMLAFFLA